MPGSAPALAILVPAQLLPGPGLPQDQLHRLERQPEPPSLPGKVDLLTARPDAPTGGFWGLRVRAAWFSWTEEIGCLGHSQRSSRCLEEIFCTISF